MERVLNGSLISWASLMLASMYENLENCMGGAGSFCFGTMLVLFFFEHVPSSRP